MTFLVSHHGTSRSIYNTSSFVSEYGIDAYSPLFEAVRFSSAEYPKGGVPSGRRTASLEQSLHDSIRASRKTLREPCYVYGFSAGGQYLSRVAAFFPCRWVTRYVIGAPSTWVWPDSRAAPFGFGNTYKTSQEMDVAIAAYLQLPLTVFCGTADNDPNGADLDRSAEAMRQGSHRLERAQNVYAAAQRTAATKGVKLNWSYVAAPGIGHSGTSLLNSRERNAAFGPA